MAFIVWDQKQRIVVAVENSSADADKAIARLRAKSLNPSYEKLTATVARH